MDNNINVFVDLMRPKASELTSMESVLAKLPPDAQKWAESLPWHQRRYLLSLCHLMCAATPETRASFLDDYTADGIIAKLLEDRDTQHKVKEYLQKFNVRADLDTSVLRGYIRQFYIHSAQDTRCQPDLYLESALRLVISNEERSHVFNYILGFELLKMMFCMSWFQHEKLYKLQRNQEEFVQLYIRPIQHTHKINHIIVPKDERLFFARRDYFIQKPVINAKKLMELAIATFTTEVTTNFGFYIIRHPQSLVCVYDYIFAEEQAVFSYNE